ncbi:hypothetical protein [Bradyrhizobium macuxiense]|uniref:hypothetical protein n=1 Tax=Bradyrhizobium macuxiense TaxID=1755647 RepID=UPI000A4775AA|nr:hypothetical protein [Bradyrhizobium macuxiense]
MTAAPPLFGIEMSLIAEEDYIRLLAATRWVRVSHPSVPPLNCAWLGAVCTVNANSAIVGFKTNVQDLTHTPDARRQENRQFSSGTLFASFIPPRRCTSCMALG